MAFGAAGGSGWVCVSGGSRGARCKCACSSDVCASELENRLQRALCDFRLIGRVGREELSALDDRVRNNRTQMIVNARAEKAGVTARILRRSLFEILNDFGFRIRPGNLKLVAQSDAYGTAGE